MDDTARKTRRVSSEQREAMLKYLKEHPKLLKGRGTPQAFRQKHNSWTELAKILNNMGSGAKKTPDRWVKSFQDWKCDLKSKQPRRAPGALERALLALIRSEEGEDPLESTHDDSSPEADPVELKAEPAEQSDSSSQRSTPEPPAQRLKRKKNSDDDKEDRAILAMEQQASSLHRMATAIERIADAVTLAIERLTNGNNNRQFV
ncbi:uncharacterized protein LOC105382667 [Plutella xylostella]|uniref:uncharacterized protein LOC105382667 n=1 Tax=Plutella xylostella TaxID=51655 RepID=UPI002032E6D6|nr:uncharacterized protein LOC105382667 [Plutella xylostella]